MGWTTFCTHSSRKSTVVHARVARRANFRTSITLIGTRWAWPAVRFVCCRFPRTSLAQNAGFDCAVAFLTMDVVTWPAASKRICLRLCPEELALQNNNALSQEFNPGGDFNVNPRINRRYTLFNTQSCHFRLHLATLIPI